MVDTNNDEEPSIEESVEFFEALKRLSEATNGNGEVEMTIRDITQEKLLYKGKAILQKEKCGISEDGRIRCQLLLERSVPLTGDEVAQLARKKGLTKLSILC